MPRARVAGKAGKVKDLEKVTFKNLILVFYCVFTIADIFITTTSIMLSNLVAIITNLIASPNIILITLNMNTLGNVT